MNIEVLSDFQGQKEDLVDIPWPKILDRLCLFLTAPFDFLSRNVEMKSSQFYEILNEDKKIYSF